MDETLLKAAKTSSTDTKQELARHVTGLLAARTDSGASEQSGLLNDVLEGVYGSLSEETKLAMSEQLAENSATSSKLAASLASEKINIAEAILQKSKSLSQEDIRKLAETMDQEHLLALAKREHISSDITKILISRGGSEVKHTIAANLGAEISLPEFEELVVDMPKQFGDRIRHLRKSNEELLEDLFRDDSEAAAGSELQRKPSKISPKAWVMGIKMGKTTLNKAIYQQCLEHNLLDVVALLSFYSGLQMKYVHKLMIRFDATGIATICRVCGLEAKEFQAICKERCKHLKFPESTGSKWLTNYHMLNNEDAKRLLHLMKIKLATAEDKEAA